MNKVGRPMKYRNSKILQKKIDQYFEYGIPKVIFVIDKKEVEVEYPTIAGLIRFLGFGSRQSFYSYKKKDEFRYTINRAVLRIEMIYEKMLFTGSACQGAIFMLKRFGWTGDYNISHKNTNGKPIIISLENVKKSLLSA